MGVQKEALEIDDEPRLSLDTLTNVVLEIRDCLDSIANEAKRSKPDMREIIALTRKAKDYL